MPGPGPDSGLAKIRKAIAGLVTPAVTFAVGWLILRSGLNIDQGTVILLDTALASVITGWVVHRIPNAP